MSPSSKRVIAGIVLTLVPVLSMYQAKQTSWARFQSTPKTRQRGDLNAPVLLVEYSDFQCPMCARVQTTLHGFLDTYKGKVRIAYKYFPLSRIHKNAMAAARAADCAADQDKFWPFHDRLFETQPQWAPLADPTTSYLAIAQETKLDTAKFTACISDFHKEGVIEQDHKEGEDRQITATPTLFVGEERLVGMVIESDGARMIERELRRK